MSETLGLLGVRDGVPEPDPLQPDTWPETVCDCCLGEARLVRPPISLNRLRESLLQGEMWLRDWFWGMPPTEVRVDNKRVRLVYCRVLARGIPEIGDLKLEEEEPEERIGQLVLVQVECRNFRRRRFTAIRIARREVAGPLYLYDMGWEVVRDAVGKIEGNFRFFPCSHREP